MNKPEFIYDINFSKMPDSDQHRPLQCRIWKRLVDCTWLGVDRRCHSRRLRRRTASWMRWTPTRNMRFRSIQHYLPACWWLSTFDWVFQCEPGGCSIQESHAFWLHPKVIVTPHVAAISKAQHVAECFRSNWDRYHSQGLKALQNVIDWNTLY